MARIRCILWFAFTPEVVIGGLFIAGVVWWNCFGKHNVGGDGPTSRAKMDILSLERATVIFYEREGCYPRTLDVMTHPGPDDEGSILKDEKVLLDPWGRPYFYDPFKQHPETRMPLIWSMGPPGRNRPIKNW